MEDLKDAMFECASLLGGVLTLAFYSAVFVTLHERLIPESRNGGTGESIVVEYTNTQEDGERCLVGSSGCL